MVELHRHGSAIYGATPSSIIRFSIIMSLGRKIYLKYSFQKNVNLLRKDGGSHINMSAKTTPKSVSCKKGDCPVPFDH